MLPGQTVQAGTAPSVHKIQVRSKRVISLDIRHTCAAAPNALGFAGIGTEDILVVAGRQDGAVAYARFQDRIESTGFARLHVESNPKYSGETQVSLKLSF